MQGHQVFGRRQKQEEGERHSRVNSLGLASLDNPCQLWGIGYALSCLVPGPGLVQDLICELDKEKGRRHSIVLERHAVSRLATTPRD